MDIGNRPDNHHDSHGRDEIDHEAASPVITGGSDESTDEIAHQQVPLLYSNSAQTQMWSQNSVAQGRPRRVLWRAANAALASVIGIAMLLGFFSTLFPDKESTHERSARSRTEISLLLMHSNEEGREHQGVSGMTEQLSHMARMGGEWGLVNPQTGAPRLQCGDSVAYGSFGSTNETERHRFHGAVGQKYTVECPSNCANGIGEIYGCHFGPYLDDSLICKAAIAAGVATNDGVSVVSFEIVEPVPQYEACTMRGVYDFGRTDKKNFFDVHSKSWTWHEWRRAEDPRRLARVCGDAWVAAHSGPCAAAIEKYRCKCVDTAGITHCYGKRAFRFLEAEKPPRLEPPSGSYLGRLTVNPVASASATVLCTTDGSLPRQGLPGTSLPPLKLGGGQWEVKCLATSAFKGDSEVVEGEYEVDTKASPPEIHPDRGEGVERLAVTISAPLDAVIRYTTDGSAPTDDSAVYTEPVEVVATGTVIRAIAAVRGLDNSDIAESEPYTIQAAEPTLSVDGGTSVGTVTVRVGVARPSEQAFCTTDGTDPTEASPRCDGDSGLEVSETGTQIRAVAIGEDVVDSEVVTSRAYVVRAQPPTFEPYGGQFEDSVAVEIVTVEEGGQAWYRIAGVAEDFAKYEEPIVVRETGTVLEAVVDAPNRARSPVQASPPYTILTPPPTISPTGRAFTAEATVAIAPNSPDTEVFYTTDGSAPSETSSKYSGPFSVTATGTVIQAVAREHGKSMSAVTSSHALEITAPAPTFSEQPGPTADSRRVFIDCPVPGARVTYTLDGSEPHPFSTPYAATQGILLRSSGKVVRALCTARGLLPSPIATSDAVRIRAHMLAADIHPDGGTFVESVRVSLRADTAGARIHYTLDGSPPSPASPAYAGPVTVSVTGTVLRAIATRRDLEASEAVASERFRIVPQAPSFSPDGGEFVGAAEVRVASGTPGAEVHCTTDGSEPSATGPVCRGGVRVEATGTVVKAVATAEGMSPSAVTEAERAFEIRAAAPTVRPDGGRFEEGVTVTMASATPGAVIRYTLDGSRVTAESAVYEKGVRVERTGVVVRAAAWAGEREESRETESGRFEIVTAAPRVWANGTRFREGDTRGVEAFVEEAQVYMQSATPGARVWYRVEEGGKEGAWEEYGGGAVVLARYGTAGVEAYAEAAGRERSETERSTVYEVVGREPRPELAPGGPGPYVRRVAVTMGHGAGAAVYFTVDGSEPSEASQRYTGPVELERVGRTEVRAVATRAGKAMSREARGAYEVLAQVATPAISPREGTFTERVALQFSCATPGARIRYTTDGSEPTAASPEYEEGKAVELTAGGRRREVVVKAMGVKAPEMGDSQVAVSGTIVVQPRAATPTLRPAGPGPYVEPVAVRMQCATPGSTIHWTGDGRRPTAQAAVYTGPVRVAGTGAVLQAVCTAPEMSESDAASSEVYVVEAAPPMFHPNGDKFVDSTEVVMTAFSPRAKIFYTLDGSEPTAHSTLYSSGVKLEHAYTVVKAVAYEPGVQPSATATSLPYVREPQPPQIAPPGGAYEDGVLVKLLSATPGALIHCTTDGSAADASSPLCDEPIMVVKTGTVISAVTSAHGLAVSEVRNATYIIRPPAPSISPSSGTFTSLAAVHLSSASEEPSLKFYYTIDGTDPTPSSSVTSGPLTLTVTGAVIRAIAVVDGMAPSQVAISGEFKIYTATPVIHQDGHHIGGGGSGATLNIECSTPQAKIFAFVPDGNIYLYHPEMTHACCWYDFDAPHAAEITIDKVGSYKVEAYAKAPTMLESRKVAREITVRRRVTAPLIEPPASDGPFHSSVVISMSSEPGSTLYYTMDGSIPTRSSARYAGPFELARKGTTAIKALACESGLPDSEVSTAFFIVE